jgi:hypothetical protein
MNINLRHNGDLVKDLWPSLVDAISARCGGVLRPRPRLAPVSGAILGRLTCEISLLHRRPIAPRMARSGNGVTNHDAEGG